MGICDISVGRYYCVTSIFNNARCAGVMTARYCSVHSNIRRFWWHHHPPTAITLATVPVITGKEAVLLQETCVVVIVYICPMLYHAHIYITIILGTRSVEVNEMREPSLKWNGWKDIWSIRLLIPSIRLFQVDGFISLFPILQHHLKYHETIFFR